MWTGSLHMGHGLTFTLQDILIRYYRMRGRDALWQPGTDHAGIATQMVVERQLDEEGLKRTDLGRDGFVDRVWEWKAESGGQITRQLRSLGASADWARERFTMDEGLSNAVTRVFVQLHREGLIYKDQRLVNWDPALETAISDLEVQQTETDGHLWYIRYPVEGGDGESLTVATTRPETMPGRYGRGGASGRPALQASGRRPLHPAACGPAASDRRRCPCRPGTGIGRSQDHPGRTTSTISRSGGATDWRPSISSTGPRI